MSAHTAHSLLETLKHTHTHTQYLIVPGFFTAAAFQTQTTQHTRRTICSHKTRFSLETNTSSQQQQQRRLFCLIPATRNVARSSETGLHPRKPRERFQEVERGGAEKCFVELELKNIEELPSPFLTDVIVFDSASTAAGGKKKQTQAAQKRKV